MDSAGARLPRAGRALLHALVRAWACSAPGLHRWGCSIRRRRRSIRRARLHACMRACKHASGTVACVQGLPLLSPSSTHARTRASAPSAANADGRRGFKSLKAGAPTALAVLGAILPSDAAGQEVRGSPHRPHHPAYPTQQHLQHQAHRRRGGQHQPTSEALLPLPPAASPSTSFPAPAASGVSGAASCQWGEVPCLASAPACLLCARSTAPQVWAEGTRVCDDLPRRRRGPMQCRARAWRVLPSSSLRSATRARER